MYEYGANISDFWQAGGQKLEVAETGVSDLGRFLEKVERKDVGMPC